MMTHFSNPFNFYIHTLKLKHNFYSRFIKITEFVSNILAINFKVRVTAILSIYHLK